MKKENNNINSQMKLLLEVLDNDVTICNKAGIIIKVGDSYQEQYKVKKEEMLGKSVYELEKKKVFSPSVSAMVLRAKKKITIPQQNKDNEICLVTGVPIFDEHDNIQYVLSFNSLDTSHIKSKEEKYEKFELIVNHYKKELDKAKTKELEFSGVITKSISMQNIFRMIINISDINANVLITGETGVGKTMISKMIHEKSDRVGKPFIEINSATIPENLLESELFGYEGGSFTGASKKGKKGKIELADNGTLFLDEIGELPLSMQKKLLQVIQEKKIMRIGGSDYINVDFRLITATNKDLKQLVERREFREDLYYRLNVLPIHIPPLRERREDILPIIMYLVEKFNTEYNRNKIMSQDVINNLISHEWQGNVRELENTIERLIITSPGEQIDYFDIPKSIRSSFSYDESKSLKVMLEEYERKIINSSYSKHKTTVAMAKALGIGQSSAVRKLQKYITDY